MRHRLSYEPEVATATGVRQKHQGVTISWDRKVGGGGQQRVPMHPHLLGSERSEWLNS